MSKPKRNQHYIPQMLLNGFSSDGKSILLFHKSKNEPKPSSTRTIGFQKDFYSTQDDMFLDDKITEHEHTLAGYLRILRAMGHLEIVDGNLASEIVHHFSIRTKFFRDFFEFFAVSIFQEFISDEQKNVVFEFLRNNLLNNLDKKIDEEFKKIVGNIKGKQYFILKRKFKIEMKKIISENNLIDESVRMSQNNLVDSSDKMKAFYHQQIEEAHKKALKDYYNSCVIKEYLTKFKWDIFETDTDIIFPDCVTLLLTKNEIYPLLLNSHEDDVTILFPIYKNKLLIGRKGNLVFDVSKYNLLAAQNSKDWFITHPSFIDDGGYHTIIGDNITDTLICQAQKCFTEYFQVQELK